MRVENITISNSRSLELGDVQAQNLSLNVQGNVTDLGTINVAGTASLLASGSITLDSQTNDFERVVVGNDSAAVTNLSLFDENNVSVQGYATGIFEVEANGVVDAAGAIQAQNVRLTSRSSVMTQNIAAANSIVLIGDEGVDINGALTVDNNDLGDAVSITSANGAVSVGATIDTSNINAVAPGDISINAASVDQLEFAEIRGNDISITSATSIDLRANINGTSSVTLVAQGGDIAMHDISGGYDIRSSEANLNATGNILTREITAERLNLVCRSGDYPTGQH